MPARRLSSAVRAGVSSRIHAYSCIMMALRRRLWDTEGEEIPALGDAKGKSVGLSFLYAPRRVIHKVC